MSASAVSNAASGGPTARNHDVELARRGWEILCARMCSHCRTNLIRHFTGRIRELKAELEALKREAPPEVGSGGAEE